MPSLSIGGSSPSFLCGMSSLGFDVALSSREAGAALLAADSFALGAACGSSGCPLLLDFIQQQLASYEPIEALLSSVLTLYL